MQGYASQPTSQLLPVWRAHADKANANGAARKYLEAVRSAAAALRALRNSAPGALGVLVETLPAHFPTGVGFLTDDVYVDTYQLDSGSFERYGVAAMLWLHTLLNSPNGSAKVQAMGVRTPAFSSWKQSPGNFDLAFPYGAAGRCAASADSDDLSCFLRARRALRPRNCSTFLEGDRRPVSWRIAFEREAAREARVPLLSAYDARAERWDAHPGIQGGADVSNAIFDCAHSSLAPGVYDGEVISLVRLLEAEAAEDVARTQL